MTDLKKCISCSRQAAPNRSRCEQCLSSSRASRRRYVEMNAEAVNASQRRARAQMIDGGLCVCGNPLADGRARCKTCLDKQRADNSRRRSLRKTLNVCRVCGGEVEGGKSHCRRCLNKVSEAIAAVRDEVIAAYGGQCACCGESEPRFLQVDHINCDGSTERAKGIVTGSLYRKLKRLGFPRDRYQLLCANCNHGRYLNGGICPHKAA